VKTPEAAEADVAKRLAGRWSRVLAGEPWPAAFGLGFSGRTARQLADTWTETFALALRWRDWEATAGPEVAVDWRPARVHGTPHELPSVLTVATIDAAARLVGGAWPGLLDRSRRRLDVLRRDFPRLDDPAAVLRATKDWSEVDFDLACRTARWFADPHPAGLTARQVPVRGLGTKWLARRQAVVRRLAGLEALDVEMRRPSRVHLTYLDPAYRRTGRRRHDVATVGDVDALPYRPRVVVISENRDTAQVFPEVPGGVAVEGDGNGPGACAVLPWVRESPALWYWGDMDVRGLEILHGYRAADLPARSLFMDRAAYDRWEDFGIDLDHDDRPLTWRPARELPLLEPGERALYLDLCSETWTRHRRIEQERIPPGEAAAVVLALG
jgi:hypothetical protein